MSTYDPDRQYFRELDQRPECQVPNSRVVLTGSVPAWQCTCHQWNGMSVERCNNCGESYEGDSRTWAGKSS